MKSPLETRSGIGKAITSFNSYVVAINESESYNSEEVNKKIKRAILWLNLNANLYGRLLSHLDIYGSEELDPETMCTNGISIIFHPKFVNSQSDEALRLVLAHEVLHCMFQHNTRRENRDPRLWNVACDYAINPLLIHDDNFNSGKWKMPIMNGKEVGLYERKYAGMRAEDIYQILLDEGAIENINQLMAQAAMVKLLIRMQIVRNLERVLKYRKEEMIVMAKGNLDKVKTEQNLERAKVNHRKETDKANLEMVKANLGKETDKTNLVIRVRQIHYLKLETKLY